MATISENLQTIKYSTDAIKQAIIDKGGTISGDITTWADAISGISGGGGELNLLKFTIITNMEYLFEDGMTWGEWVSSIFNLSGSHYGKLYIQNQQVLIDNSIYIQSFYIIQQGGIVTSDDMIIPNGNYELQGLSSGGSGN